MVRVEPVQISTLIPGWCGANPDFSRFDRCLHITRHLMASWVQIQRVQSTCSSIRQLAYVVRSSECFLLIRERYHSLSTAGYGMRTFTTPTATGELIIGMYYPVDTTCSIFSPARVFMTKMQQWQLSQPLGSSLRHSGRTSDNIFSWPREGWGIVERIRRRFDLENLRLFIFFFFFSGHSEFDWLMALIIGQR